MAMPRRLQQRENMVVPGGTGDPLLDNILSRAEFQPGSSDLRDSLADMHYLVADKNVEKILKRDPRTESLTVGTSALVRTSKKDKKSRNIAKHQWNISCTVSLLAMRKPQLVDLSLFNNLMIYGHSAIDDTADGWRGLLVTNKMRTIRVERGQARAGGLRAFLGVR